MSITRLTHPRNATRHMAVMTATDPSVFLINAPKTLLLLITASRSPVRLNFDNYALPFHGQFGFPTSRSFGSIRSLYSSPHAPHIYSQSIMVEAVRVSGVGHSGNKTRYHEPVLNGSHLNLYGITLGSCRISVEW